MNRSRARSGGGFDLVHDLLTRDGTLIAPAETEVSQILLEKLYNFAQLSGIKEPIQVVSAWKGVTDDERVLPVME